MKRLPIPSVYKTQVPSSALTNLVSLLVRSHPQHVHAHAHTFQQEWRQENQSHPQLHRGFQAKLSPEEMAMDRRDGSAVKNTGCSWREPGLGSQHTWCTPFITPVSGNPVLSPAFIGTKHVCGV